MQSEVSDEAVALSRVFVAPDSASAETGNGLNRKPSPTEKHKQAMTLTKRVVRTKQDVVLRSVLIIDGDNSTRIRWAATIEGIAVPRRDSRVIAAFSYLRENPFKINSELSLQGES